jgi:hypothetical protein
VLVVVVRFGLKMAVTPLGRPDADKVTPPLKPFCAVTVIVLVPPAPCMMLRLLGDAERVKFGGPVTVNVTGLLSFMLGATETTKGPGPEVAPNGIVIVIDVPLALQESIVTGAPFSVTMLPPCDAPNPVPEITAWLPTNPMAGETLVMTGAGTAGELIDTLSNVAVARVELLSLLTASPMYTFCAMLIVWLVPNGTQFTPSGERYPLNVLPLRTNFTQ